MFEVKNAIYWETAKKLFTEGGYDIYYDQDNHDRILIFAELDECMCDRLDDIFGGEWRYIVNKNDIDTNTEGDDVLQVNFDKNIKDQYYLNKIREEVSVSEVALKKHLTKIKNEVPMSEVNFTQWDHPTVKSNDAIVRLFPERLMMFLSEFSDLLNVKNKAYGNSALEPLNVFSKASSSEVILQQIDHKLSRLKNSDKPSKNDVIDLMGYLTLYCLDQSWLDLKDLHK